MRDDERDAAVKAHLAALDAEIDRLRQQAAALDRKIAERERAEHGERAPQHGEDEVS